MALSPSEEKKIEELLEQALLEGLREGQRRAFGATIKAAAARVLQREVSDVVGAFAEGGPQGALTALKAAARGLWQVRWRDALEPILSALMQGATEVRAPVFGSFGLENPVMREYLDGYTSELADTLSTTSYDNFERILRDGQRMGLSVPEVSRRLEEHLPEVNKARADLISRTELIRASNGASLQQAKASGVATGKRWLATMDERVRPEHLALDGVVVGIDEAFSNGLQVPGEPNCRCTLTFEINFDALERLPA